MFTIDGLNCDEYIVEKKYTVLDSPEFGGTEYQDGWWKKHRTIVRNRVTGTVTLAMSATDYSSFVSHIQSHEGVEGDHAISLFVNNLNAQKSITAYVKITANVAISTKAFGQDPVFFSVKLAIEER